MQICIIFHESDTNEMLLGRREKRYHVLARRGGGGIVCGRGGITFDSDIRLQSHMYPKVDNISMYYLP